MRKTCPLCSLKHLGQARALLLEWKQGYPEHFDFALGHLAEASDELADDYPALAAVIRSHRKLLEENPEYKVPFATLCLTIRGQTGYDLNCFVNPEGPMQKFNRFLKTWLPVAALVLAFTAQAGLDVTAPVVDRPARADIVVLQNQTNAPLWLAQTNTELTITLTNDMERPQYLYATGAVSLAFSGLRPPQPFYLIVHGPDSLSFPVGTHFIGGATWQTNQANHFIVWQFGTNLFCNPITTSEN